MGSELNALPRAFVMMATYNGEKYLEEQINSILRQKGVGVTLRVCDDRSSDNTFDIAARYSMENDAVIATKNQVNKGVGINFMQMVYEVNADKYDIFAFSDQDDCWLPEKLATAAVAIRETEESDFSRRVDGIGVPVLYCSDLQNTDSNLDHPWWELRRLDIDQSKRATPLLRNYYSGCTMVMNSAMVRLLQLHKLSEMPRIHDAWCALVAYYCGNLILDRDHALILRRISGNNTVGASAPGVDIAKSHFSNLGHKAQRLCTLAARELLAGYSDFITLSDLKMIQSFSSYASSFRGRVQWAFRDDYSAATLAETLLLKVKLLFGRY